MKKYINAILGAVGAVCVVASLALSAAYAVGMDSFVSVRIGSDGSGTALPDTLDFINTNARIQFQQGGDIAFGAAGEMISNTSLSLSSDNDDVLFNGRSLLEMYPPNPGIPVDSYINLISVGTNEATSEEQYNCVLLGDNETLNALGLPPTTLHAANSDSGMCSVELDGTNPDAVNAQVRVNRTGEAFMSSRSGAEVYVDGVGNAGIASAADDGLELVAQSSVTCLANGDVVVQLGPLP